MLELSGGQWIPLVAAASVLLLVIPWVFVVRRRRREAWLLVHGRDARARVLSYRPSGLTLGSGSANMKGVTLELEVYPDTGDPYRVRVRSQLHLLDLSSLRSGMTVAVRVDPSDPRRIAIRDWQDASAE